MYTATCLFEQLSEWSYGPVYIQVHVWSGKSGEPVWPSGKALGWYAEGPRVESVSALHLLQKLWSVDTVL